MHSTPNGPSSGGGGIASTATKIRASLRLPRRLLSPLSSPSGRRHTTVVVPDVVTTPSSTTESPSHAGSVCQLGFRSEWHAGENIWYGPDAQSVPSMSVSPLSPKVFATDTGPSEGIVLMDTVEQPRPYHMTGDGKDFSYNRFEGPVFWTMSNRKAVGQSVSLYERHPITGKVSGDPIADCYFVCARENNALMGVADGVNWGEDAKIAARTALHTAFHFVNTALFRDVRGPPKKLANTQEVLDLLLEAFTHAHDAILERTPIGLTTLCLALVLPLAAPSPHFAVCVVNLGDSLAFLLSKFHGLREITVGSHCLDTARNIRDAGGALGAAREGNLPELNNLTCSLTLCDPGDLVFLTSDGVSDNFDPVVTRLAMPESPLQGLPFADDEEESMEDAPPLSPRSNGGVSQETMGPDFKENVEIKASQLNFTQKLEMSPSERQRYTVKEMERIWHETEMVLCDVPSAREWTKALISCIQLATEPRRAILQDPSLYRGRKRTPEETRREHQLVAERIRRTPGKLDHASLCVMEVGRYRGNEFEVYEETQRPTASPTSAVLLPGGERVLCRDDSMELHKRWDDYAPSSSSSRQGTPLHHYDTKAEHHPAPVSQDSPCNETSQSGGRTFQKHPPIGSSPHHVINPRPVMANGTAIRPTSNSRPINGTASLLQ